MIVRADVGDFNWQITIDGFVVLSYWCVNPNQRPKVF